MKKSVQIVLGTAVSAALLLASTPAFAAPRSLPAGEALYAFGCSGGTEPAVGIVDVATGAVTEVVAGQDPNQCFSGPAYNPVDGKIYVVDLTVGFDLAVFDPAAKTLSVIDSFDCEPLALAIDASGNAWVWDSAGEPEELRPVSLENAACGAGVGVVSIGDFFSGMAFAPNGTLYASNYDTGQFGTISTSNGAFTPLGSSAMAVEVNSGLTFDSSGIAWVLDDDNEAEVYSADITDYQGTKQLSGQLDFTGDEYYSQGIVVGPTDSPKLPDTGSASVALGVTGLAAAGVIALGVAMMIVRRRAS
jgi:hypothetical protein